MRIPKSGMIQIETSNTADTRVSVPLSVKDLSLNEILAILNNNIVELIEVLKKK